MISFVASFTPNPRHEKLEKRCESLELYSKPKLRGFDEVHTVM